jgi:hypothetical protein
MLLVMGTVNAERDEQIRRAYYAGTSAIELGATHGLSRSQVHRIVAAGPPDVDDFDDDDFDEDDEGLCEPEPTPPFTYCGTELVRLVGKKGDELRAVKAERWTDANGRACSELDLYRASAHPAGEGDYERSDAIRAQIDAERERWRQRWGETRP